jgi:uncharacterized membrane protein HdeD (DUF308 family)
MMGTAPSATPWAGRPRTLAPVAALKRARRWLMVAGVLSLIGGVVAIALPNIASVATAIFIGWLLVFAAALNVIDAFSTRDGTHIALRLLLAALTFAAGLYLLLAPLDGTFTLTVILVLWFVAVGIARIVMGVTYRATPGAWLFAVSGALELGLGLLIAMGLPDSATWAVGLIVGIDLLFGGVVMIDYARRLRVPAA